MFRQIEEIRETLFNYIESRIELLQLETRERIEAVILKALFFSIAAVLLFFTLLFLLILLSVGLNIWLDSRFAGYLIMLGVFGILSLLWFLFKIKWLSVLRAMLTKMAEKKEPQTP